MNLFSWCAWRGSQNKPMMKRLQVDSYKTCRLCNIVYRSLLTITIIFTVLLSTPVLATFLVTEAVDLLGGSFEALDGTPSPCYFFGLDISERLQPYFVPILGSIGTPLAFAIGFYDVLIALGLLTVFALILRKQIIS